MDIDTWPPEGNSPVLIRGYHSRRYEDLIESFHRDAVLLLSQGYEPAGQHYVEGQWGAAWGLLALLLTPLIVGLVIWSQILSSRPIGKLTVTYIRRAPAH